MTGSTGSMTPRPAFQVRNSLFIGGRWASAEGKSVTQVLDSATEEPVGEVHTASGTQLDAAVQAARNALPEWAAKSPAERAQYLGQLQRQLVSRADAMAALIAAEVGTPLRLAKSIQVGLPIAVLGSYVELLGEFDFQETIGNSVVLREPVGVVAAITPWNYPLHQAVAKVAAALAAGSTIVLKPSTLAQLNVFALADAVEAAELPPGVFNLVAGPGSEIGDAMARHHGIDMISFTGSTAAGIQVAKTAAESLKRLSLELGGKSANILLDDADFQRAVSAGVNNAFLNSGQTCSAWTRMLVPVSHVADVLDLARAAAQRLTLGDPFDESTRLGPLVSSGQMGQVGRFVESGIAEGATLVLGGPERPSSLERGFYFQPTIFSDVVPQMQIAQEEIFGPVLAIMPYVNETEAIQIANATGYGLAGAVWSADPEHATRIAREMRTGQVDINGGRFNPLAPFGGFGKSGYGRELGRFGLEEFLELKALQY